MRDNKSEEHEMAEESPIKSRRIKNKSKKSNPITPWEVIARLNSLIVIEVHKEL
jgi:hypothetical protein